MEKRALLAVVLSIVVIYFFQAYVAPPPKPPLPREGQKEMDLFADEDKVPFDDENKNGFEADVFATDSSSSFVEQEIFGSEVRVDTNLYTALFSKRGGVLKSLTLKKYLDELGPEGKPVEMVTGKEPGLFPLALTLRGKESVETQDMIFTANKDSLWLTDSEPFGSVVFTGTTSEGIKIVKSFVFQPNSYLITLDVDVIEPPDFSPVRGVILSWVRALDPKKDKSSTLGFIGPAAYAAGKLHEVKIDDLKGGHKTFTDAVGWAGYEDKYFMAAFLPRREGSALVARMLLPKEDVIKVSCYDQGYRPESGEGTRYGFGLFCGPKDIDILKSLDPNLAKAIDFGMFDVIAKPLLYALKYVNSVTNNYGVAIIIITIFLKIITFPLTHKSYKSMKSLKDLQPKMEELKKKYKDDREKLNVETMNMYRSHKVNPLGGCLPMLVQFPIFIAFYWMLLGSIELRHAPFMLWIKDLSSQDPYYITPILMGASMFITQKMTPTSVDPTQAKIMLAMPVVFTVLFLNFPAGLVIYWLVNNVLQIFQQLYIDKRVS